MKLSLFLRQGEAGLTLVEVVLATATAALSIGGTIYGYIRAAQSAEWSAYHLAAHSLAMQRVEQCRAAKWDLNADPVVDNLVDAYFPKIIEIIDIPISNTNFVYATNWTTITDLSTTPPLKMIRVDCTWYFNPSGRAFTNTVISYRAPDQ